MWRLTTAEGREICERDCLWPDLPTDMRITALVFGDARLADQEAYGFQRYQVTKPCGLVTGRGAQILGIRGDVVTILDVGQDTGLVVEKKIPVTELTYARGLLRPGHET